MYVKSSQPYGGGPTGATNVHDSSGWIDRAKPLPNLASRLRRAGTPALSLPDIQNPIVFRFKGKPVSPLTRGDLKLQRRVELDAARPGVGIRERMWAEPLITKFRTRRLEEVPVHRHPGLGQDDSVSLVAPDAIPGLTPPDFSYPQPTPIISTNPALDQFNMGLMNAIDNIGLTPQQYFASLTPQQVASIQTQAAAIGGTAPPSAVAIGQTVNAVTQLGAQLSKVIASGQQPTAAQLKAYQQALAAQNIAQQSSLTGQLSAILGAPGVMTWVVGGVAVLLAISLVAKRR